jgi:hypothetical protein
MTRKMSVFVQEPAQEKEEQTGQSSLFETGATAAAPYSAEL